MCDFFTLHETGLKYTTLTKKAMRVCYQAHSGQCDASGIPYVFHPFHLAEQMDSETEICVALLHDVLEDTDWTIEDLEREGFPEEVLEPVRLLTHDPEVPYMDYIAIVRKNPVAKKVKLADLKHNRNLDRLDFISDYDRSRYRKYCEAEKVLLEIEAPGDSR